MKSITGKIIFIGPIKTHSRYLKTRTITVENEIYLIPFELKQSKAKNATLNKANGLKIGDEVTVEYIINKKYKTIVQDIKTLKTKTVQNA